MERRDVLGWLGGMGAAGAVLAAGDPHAGHDHAAMMQMGAPAAAPRKYDGLIPAFQECTRAAQACIAHCQELLAQGDKAMGACLRTALDTDAVCSTVLRLASLNSRFTGALAKSSVPVMEACIKACKEHVNHHAECKACHDACLKAVELARAAT